jgi:hypothetical protein
MLRTLTLLIVGLTVAGIALAAKAQPFGYYPGPSPAYAYRYEPPRAYGPDGQDTGFRYFNGYDGFNGSSTVAPPLITAWNPALPAPTLGAVPTDVFGPNPGGMVGPDGRRIHCQVVGRWSAIWGRYVGQRECRAR